MLYVIFWNTSFFGMFLFSFSQARNVSAEQELIAGWWAGNVERWVLIIAGLRIFWESQRPFGRHFDSGIWIESSRLNSWLHRAGALDAVHAWTLFKHARGVVRFSLIWWEGESHPNSPSERSWFFSARLHPSLVVRMELRPPSETETLFLWWVALVTRSTPYTTAKWFQKSYSSILNFHHLHQHLDGHHGSPRAFSLRTSSPLRCDRVTGNDLGHVNSVLFKITLPQSHSMVHFWGLETQLGFEGHLFGSAYPNLVIVDPIWWCKWLSDSFSWALALHEVVMAALLSSSFVPSQEAKTGAAESFRPHSRVPE